MLSPLEEVFFVRYFCLFLLILGWPMSAYLGGNAYPLTPTEISAVVQAVEDEIYVEGSYTDYYQVAENIGTPRHWKSRVHIYINPEYGGEFEGNDGVGEAIYKFMPYGEIIRLFRLSNGHVQLIGDPENAFPITQPSHRTIFYDDEAICKLKEKWVKRFFVVDISPSQEMVQEAQRRQKARMGYF